MDIGIQVHQVIVLTKHIRVSLIVANARMVTTVALCGTHDIVLPLPRTHGRVAHGIAQCLRTASRGISQIVFTITLIEPRTFLVVLHLPGSLFAPWSTEVDLSTLFLDRTHHAILLVEHKDIAAGRDHVLIELDTIDMRVAPVHISLSVVINKHRGVDIIPVLRLPHQGLAKGILERTIRRVGYQDADAMTMKRCIEIILAIALYGLYGPCTIVAGAPREFLQ